MKKNDIHIHIPEGAIPKDGPSAGITMATALISALTNRAVSREVAMTGEITLRGRVLPIGGLKEKSLAAHRAGIRKVLMPAENKRDLNDIPESVRAELTFVPVSHMDEVLAHALVEPFAIRLASAPGGGTELSEVGKEGALRPTVEPDAPEGPTIGTH